MLQEDRRGLAGRQEAIGRGWLLLKFSVQKGGWGEGPFASGT